MIRGKLIKRVVILCFVSVILAYMYRWSPYKFEFLGHYDKIWADRVNSIEKLESAIHFFEGVELDLVYLEDKTVLDVNHPPALSIGLDFESYFSVLEQDKQPFMWLDIKNLNVDNAQRILNRLIFILEKKKYPLNKILIETTQPKALLKFNLAGFKTSYYLPYGLSSMPEDELGKTIRLIKDELKEQPTMGISSDYHDYDVMAKYFPSKTKYLWALLPTFHTNFKSVKKPLNDDTVQVLLIKYNALNGNR